MDTKTIRVNTYVDIATTLARQPRPHREPRTNSKDVMARGNFTDIWSIRSDWEKRIKRWQEEVHGRRTSIKSINLRDMRIGTLFLQHPIPGVAVWNIFQACYEIDRIVCSRPKLRQVITGWEELPMLQYLDNPEIKECWKESLGDMRAAISENKSHAEQPTENEFLRFEKDGDRKKNRKRPGVEEHISAISYGVDNLEDLWYELSKSFQVSPDMKDAVHTKEILDAIVTSIVRKFAMISTALKDESSNAVTTGDSIQSISKLSTSMSFY
ncbi:hypothetical protein HYALB_00000889 [Hymenoscyphus albidus]|uniref:Uncharacterized protein n=1 Tax=Hymenoscyphus albidus TaxID=595503 RepID=A0A9N9L9B7_9HELO|nr:hypothetical protein HYALB_00000889 [Hymenoscyphus albidus]